MSFDPIKAPRWLTMASLLALGAAGAIGCATEDGDAAAQGSSDEEAASVEDITQVKHSKVKRQSIGNCWIYAVASWVEALNQAATGTEIDTSESWLTYWHWFEQLANGGASDEISTGGSYGTAADLIVRYGIVLEKDFIATESESEMSGRQSSALAAVNAGLKGGPLKDAVAMRDRAAIRRELDKAWGLDPAVVTKMNRVFGVAVTRTIDRSYVSRRPGYGIMASRELKARLRDPETRQFTTGTIDDALGRSGGGWWAPRSGKLAWNEVNYPGDEAGRREFWKRVQKALHDEQPVVTSWAVDFNALSSASRFSLAELSRRGPGSQGGHMTVMHDYQAEVPGLGLLEAGKPATPAQMDAALSDGTKIEFVRVKNSWGGIRPDRWSEAAIPGYHDLELAYLNGPIKKCGEKPDGTTDTSNCTSQQTPLWDVVLPAGY